ncbi:MAG: hypothetical protein HPZ91_07305 [Lentisphaeria bacterium]|nr:hypothetical protein [Lentisphaeria bacterium]
MANKITVFYSVDRNPFYREYCVQFVPHVRCQYLIQPEQTPRGLDTVCNRAGHEMVYLLREAFFPNLQMQLQHILDQLYTLRLPQELMKQLYDLIHFSDNIEIHFQEVDSLDIGEMQQRIQSLKMDADQKMLLENRLKEARLKCDFMQKDIYHWKCMYRNRLKQQRRRTRKNRRRR